MSDYPHWMKLLTDSKNQAAVQEYIGECYHNSFEGFRPVEVRAIERYLKDCALYVMEAKK